MSTQRKSSWQSRKTGTHGYHLSLSKQSPITFGTLLILVFPIWPIALSKPIEPIFDPSESAATFDPKAFEFYKAQQVMYKPRLARYNEQKTAFTAIISFIQETIIIENAIFIQIVEPNPYNLLIALKQRLAPTDQARSLYLERRYEKLKKGPGNQYIETSVNDWQRMYTNTLTHRLAEVSEHRPKTSSRAESSQPQSRSKPQSLLASGRF